MSDKKSEQSGSCLCGAVKFEVTGPMRDIMYCHCTQCRKTSGHHFAATACDKPDLIMTEDKGLAWYQSSDDAKRGFCNQCGSSLFWNHDKLDYISVLAGSLDQPTNLKVSAHIFTEDKGDYFTFTDGLPQYESYPPAEVHKTGNVENVQNRTNT